VQKGVREVWKCWKTEWSCLQSVSFSEIPPRDSPLYKRPSKKIWEVFLGDYRKAAQGTLRNPLGTLQDCEIVLTRCPNSDRKRTCVALNCVRVSESRECSACETEKRVERARERPREDLETGGIEWRESGCLRAKETIEEDVAGGSNANRDTVSGNGAPRCGARSGDGLLREASGHLFLGSDHQAVCRRCPRADSSAGYSHWPWRSGVAGGVGAP